jgi:hypothetical protein
MYSKLSSLLWFPPEAHHEVTSKLESLLYRAPRFSWFLGVAARHEELLGKCSVGCPGRRRSSASSPLRSHAQTGQSALQIFIVSGHRNAS